MEGFYVLVIGTALFGIVLAIYFAIQDKKEEKKRKVH